MPFFGQALGFPALPLQNRSQNCKRQSKILLSPWIGIHPKHLFLLCAWSSQILSNVPATVLLVEFTDQWRPLLWGSNVGGFGSLVGSVANLIAYKLYLSHLENHDALRFTLRFLTAGYVAFFLGVGLYEWIFR